jgi:hypothetical protein
LKRDSILKRDSEFIYEFTVNLFPDAKILLFDVCPVLQTYNK